MDKDLFGSAVDTAFERQGQPAGGHDVRSVIARGRRRLALRMVGGLTTVLVLTAGTLVSVRAVTGDEVPVPPADAAAVGVEKIMEFGGPLAVSGDHLYVANNRISNNAGDKGSIARVDLSTGSVKDSPPTTAANPLNIASGSEGLWLVRWSGDMPAGGEGNPVEGNVQLVDPASGEVIRDWPMKDAAPYDVEASDIDGVETAWVADSANDRLLGFDAASEEARSISLGSRPMSVVAAGDVVWVSSNQKGQGALTRFDVSEDAVQAKEFGHCVTELVLVDDSVWATDYCSGTVNRFDATTLQESAAVAVGEAPSAITFADGLLWIATRENVVRIDPATEKVVGEPIELAEVSHLVSAGEDVYAWSGTAGGVFRLGPGAPAPTESDPPTDEENEEPADEEPAASCQESDDVMCIPLDREWSVAGAGFGTAWVGNVGEGKTFGIVRYDEDSGEEVARLPMNGFVEQFTADDRWMWATVDTGEVLTLLRIDPTTTKVDDSYELGNQGDIGEPSLAVGDRYVWVSLGGGTVQRISKADGEMTTFPYWDGLDGYSIDNGPLKLATSGDFLFLSYGLGHLGVVEQESGTFLRLDKDVLGVNAYEITVAGGFIWSPHQSPEGENVVSFTPVGGASPRGRASLEAANPTEVVTDGARLWVLQDGFGDGDPGWVLELDPETQEPIRPGIEIDTGFRGDIAVSNDYLWVTGDKVLYRIEV